MPRPEHLQLGAVPTPRWRLAAAEPFQPTGLRAGPVAWVPDKMDYWGNNQYGCCVSSEEAFAKAAIAPRIFADAPTVINWARRHGFLNGAMLPDVMDAMAQSGYQINGSEYKDGPYKAVNYSDDSVLQAACAVGPVKIGIDHAALPSGAGNESGWFSLGAQIRPHHSMDHCVGLAGCGPASWLYQQIKQQVPSGLPPDTPGYLLFTWSTLGFVDHDWVMKTCGEAWIRNPTTPGYDPVPPTPPTPPTPAGGWSVRANSTQTHLEVDYHVGTTGFGARTIVHTR